MKKRDRILALSLAAALLLAEPAGAQVGVSFERGKESLYKSRDLIFEGGKAPEIADLLEDCTNIFSKLETEAERCYWLAYVNYLRGMIAAGKNEGKAAEENFGRAEQLLSQSLRARESGEALVLLSDVYSQLMNYKGFFFQIAHGNDLRRLPEKAIRLDPGNYPAYTSLAVFFLNAPAFAGGNIDQAVSNLLVGAKSADPYDRFIANIWLSKAYLRMKEYTEARKSISVALDIYPHNGWAKGISKDIEESLSRK